MIVTRRKLLQIASGTGLSLGFGWNPLATAKSGDIITRPIPGSDEVIPVVGIGTNRYRSGSDTENATLRETLRVFHSLGGTMIDTAPAYRSSEQILGQLIHELKIRDDLFVATKVELIDQAGALQRMTESLERLQTDSLDLVQSHSMRGAEKTLPVMREWHQDGRVHYVGITTSRNNEFPRMLDLMNKEKLEFIQVNYSLANREAAQKILPLARDKGIAVMINLPFGRGSLFNTLRNQTLPDWAKEFDCHSWAQFLLKYVVSHPAVTCAIPGTTKPHHAQDNFGAALGQLPDAGLRHKQEQFFDTL
jgi:aryl-alcohol dehydrogenase-like predicted oxidoreductase